MKLIRVITKIGGKTTTIVLASLLLSLSNVNGTLVFAKKTTSSDLEYGAEKFDFSFSFVNSGEESIQIEKVSAMCGCTTTTLKKSRIESGDSGVISGTFMVGDRKGHQVKAIKVFTNDQEEPQITLTLELTIPQIAKLTPRLLVWHSGDITEEKTISLELNGDYETELKSVTLSNDKFRMEKTSNRRIHVFTFKPVNSGERKQSAVVFKISDPLGTEIIHVAHLLVR